MKEGLFMKKKNLILPLAMLSVIGSLASCGGNTVTQVGYEASYTKDCEIIRTKLTVKGGKTIECDYDAVYSPFLWANVTNNSGDLPNIEYIDGPDEMVGLTPVSLKFAKSIRIGTWKFTASYDENEANPSIGYYCDYKCTDIRNSPMQDKDLFTYFHSAVIDYGSSCDWYYECMLKNDFAILDKDDNDVVKDKYNNPHGAYVKSDVNFAKDDVGTAEEWKTNKRNFASFILNKWNKVYPVSGSKNIKCKIVAKDGGGLQAQGVLDDEVKFTEDIDDVTFTRSKATEYYTATNKAFKTVELGSYSFY